MKVRAKNRSAPAGGGAEAERERGMDIIKDMETAEETKGKAFVHWRGWHTAYPGLVSPEALERWTLDKCEEIAFRRADPVLVAKDGARVVGFIGYGESAEEPGAGEIFALYVLPEYAGQGIGTRLMRAGLDRLRAHARVFLWLLKENGPALRFYRKCGFVPDGKEKFSAAVGAAGIRMVLERPAPVAPSSRG